MSLINFESWDFPGLACSMVNCGEGTCRASKATVLGIECDCKPGWKQIPLASFAIPSCVLPNCKSLPLHSIFVVYLIITNSISDVNFITL